MINSCSLKPPFFRARGGAIKKPIKKPDASSGEISDLQRRFVAEYLIDLNGYKAAVRAGYAEAGASPQAWRLLRNAKIAALIDVELKKRGDRTGVKADRVVLELARIAFADVKQVAKWDDNRLTYVTSEELDDEASAAIAEITDKTTEHFDKNGQVSSVKREMRVKMHDKLRALEMLGRHLALFTDKVDVAVLTPFIIRRPSGETMELGVEQAKEIE